MTQSNAEIDDAVLRNQGRISNVDYVKCCCGKKCKGLRGLKGHQRSCRFIKGMCSDLLLPHEGEITNEHDQISDADEDIFNGTPILNFQKLNINGKRRIFILEPSWNLLILTDMI